METVIDNIRQRILSGGEHLVSASLSSLVNVVAIMIYLILVPLMVFFMLKDKRVLMGSLRRFLPRNRTLVNRVWVEMNNQIINYIRGKVIENPDRRYRHLCSLCPDGAALLGAAGGGGRLLGVDPLYRRCRGDRAGSHGGAVPVGTHPEFAWLMVAYLVIQALDGNLLVPVLFSEAVNLHPVAIIIAVLVFGGLWGFWGVFFAIPLATLVKAVINAWPKREDNAHAVK